MTTTTGTRSSSLDGLDLEVASMMRRAKRVMTERARLIDEGLTGGGYLMLTHVASDGPMRAADLCDRLGLDKGAASRQIQHLVDLGLVAGSPDPADGRATLLAVTDHGRDRLRDVAVERRRFVKERLADWSADDLDHLVALLGRFNRSLEG